MPCSFILVLLQSQESIHLWKLHYHGHGWGVHVAQPWNCGFEVGIQLEYTHAHIHTPSIANPATILFVGAWRQVENQKEINMDIHSLSMVTSSRESRHLHQCHQNKRNCKNLLRKLFRTGYHTHIYYLSLTYSSGNKSSEMLEPVPADFRWETENSLDRSPIYNWDNRETNNHSLLHSHLWPI